MRLSRLFLALALVACAPAEEAMSGDDSGSSDTTAPTTMSTSTTSTDESGPAGECGNGMVEAPEACDDGNLIAADGCSAECRTSGTVEWERTLEGGAGWAVAPSPTGEAIVVGNDAANDIFIGAWTVDGEQGYQATVAGTGAIARALAIVIDGGGAQFMVGIDGDEGAFDGFARRVTAPDTVDWAAPFGMAAIDDWATDVAFDPDGDLIVVGHGDAGGPTGVDVWVARVDTGSGSVMETFPIEQMGDDAAWGVDVSAAGDIVVAGAVAGMMAGTDVAVWRLGADGTVTWTQTQDGDDLDRGADAAFDPATDDVVVVGTASSNIWLRRYAPDGSDLFTKTVDSGVDTADNADEGNAVAVDQHGNIVVTGGLAAEDTKSGWTRKWSPDATEELWTVELAGSSGVPTVGRGIAIAADGSVYATGSEGDSVWVVRYTG